MYMLFLYLLKACAALPASTAHPIKTGLSTDKYPGYEHFPTNTTCPIAGPVELDGDDLKAAVHDNLEYRECQGSKCSVYYNDLHGTDTIVVEFVYLPKHKKVTEHAYYTKTWVDSGVCFSPPRRKL